MPKIRCLLVDDHTLFRQGVRRLLESESDFEVIGDITDVETIAKGVSVRERKSLSRRYGTGRWRKLKGVALVRLPEGTTSRAEIHWFEAHGVGRRKLKIKRLLD